MSGGMHRRGALAGRAARTGHGRALERQLKEVGRARHRCHERRLTRELSGMHNRLLNDDDSVGIYDHWLCSGGMVPCGRAVHEKAAGLEQGAWLGRFSSCCLHGVGLGPCRDGLFARSTSPCIPTASTSQARARAVVPMCVLVTYNGWAIQIDLEGSFKADSVNLLKFRPHCELS